MAVLPEDLLAPVGELELALFPGMIQADIDVRLQAYIDQATGLVAGLAAADRDEAITAWAYYRAFSARAQQLAAIPTSTAIPGEISTTRTDGQRAYFEGAAQRWLDIYEAAFELEEEASDFPATGATVNQYRYPGLTG